MLLPKKDRIAVYKYLFKEGVLVACNDYRLPKDKATGVKNVYLLSLMRSFKSREFVREINNWKHKYFFLTDAGVEYLREYLHLPLDAKPLTQQPPARSTQRERRPEGGRGGDRDFRRGGDRGAKKMGAPGDNWRPNYGAGRGAYRAAEGTTPQPQ